MAKRVVHVLLPNGLKAEANEARRALAPLNWGLVMGTLGLHSAGQTIPGDVVVVGPMRDTIKADALGKVYQVDTLAGLEGLAKEILAPSKPKPKKEEPAPVSVGTVLEVKKAKTQTEELLPAAQNDTKTPEPEVPVTVERRETGRPLEPVDEFERMDRVKRIQYAAGKWPGQRRWATLSDEQLLVAMRELSAS